MGQLTGYQDSLTSCDVQFDKHHMLCHIAYHVCTIHTHNINMHVHTAETPSAEARALTKPGHILRFTELFFFFFKGRTHGIWGFPSQGSNQSFSHWPTSQPQQHRIQASSATYTTAHRNPLSKARNQTRNLMVTTQICSRCTAVGTPRTFFFNYNIVDLQCCANFCSAAK